MNGWEFTAQVIGSVAWPLAVVAAAVIFRSEFKGLIKRLQSGELWGAKFNFGDAIAETERLRESAPELPANESSDPPGGPKTAPPTNTAGASTFDELVGEFVVLAAVDADANPSYSMLAAWERADNTLRRYERELDDFVGRPKTGLPRSVLHLQHFDRHVNAMYQQLRELRNKVAHGQADPTTGEAVAFVENAEWLVARVREMVVRHRAGITGGDAEA